jgi:hypothetical protein
VAAMAQEAAGIEPAAPVEPTDRLDRAAIPYLTEPWYC